MSHYHRSTNPNGQRQATASREYGIVNGSEIEEDLESGYVMGHAVNMNLHCHSGARSDDRYCADFAGWGTGGLFERSWKLLLIDEKGMM